MCPRRVGPVLVRALRALARVAQHRDHPHRRRRPAARGERDATSENCARIAPNCAELRQNCVLARRRRRLDEALEAHHRRRRLREAARYEHVAATRRPSSSTSPRGSPSPPPGRRQAAGRRGAGSTCGSPPAAWPTRSRCTATARPPRTSTTCPPAPPHVSTCARLHAPSTAHISAFPTRGSRQYTSANTARPRRERGARVGAPLGRLAQLGAASDPPSRPPSPPPPRRACRTRSSGAQRLNCAPSAHSDPGRAPPSAHHWLYAQVAPLPLSKVASSTQSSIGARRESSKSKSCCAVLDLRIPRATLLETVSHGGRGRAVPGGAGGPGGDDRSRP